MKKPSFSERPVHQDRPYFHSTKDGKIHWQGFVLGRYEPGFFLVQLFDWLGGQPNVSRIVKVDDMVGWRFYTTAQEMKDYWLSTCSQS